MYNILTKIRLKLSTRDNSSFVLCPKNGSDTEIRPNKVKVEYKVCEPTDMLDTAIESVPEILAPLTRRDDLFSNDYEGLNSLVMKVENSTLLNKTRNSFFGWIYFYSLGITK